MVQWSHHFHLEGADLATHNADPAAKTLPSIENGLELICVISKN